MESKFRDHPELSQRARELKDAVCGAVIKERHQNLPDKTLELSGLAIFGMGTEIELYKQLAFSQHSHWSDFVEERMRALEKLLKAGK